MKLIKVIAVSLVSLLFISSAQAKKEVTLLMDWFPQGNQSVFWQAQFDTKFSNDLKIKVKSGGPKINTAAAVAAGQADFGLQGSDSVMQANSKGAGLVAVFANLNHVPYTLVFHPNQGIKSVKDLQGRRFAVKMGVTYWKWVKAQYGVTADEFPLKGDLGLFARTPTMFQQGYSLFLPARLAAKGVATEQITLESLGYRPYSTLFTTQKMIDENPELVAKVIKKLRASFVKSLNDPKPTADFILSKSKKVNRAIHMNAIDLMKKDFLPKDYSKLGCMSPARWEENANQLKQVNVIPADFDPKTSYDLSFLGNCE
jgi:NitT/TauT family transport system substrate-binding protein